MCSAECWCECQQSSLPDYWHSLSPSQLTLGLSLGACVAGQLAGSPLLPTLVPTTRVLELARVCVTGTATEPNPAASTASAATAAASNARPPAAVRLTGSAEHRGQDSTARPGPNAAPHSGLPPKLARSLVRPCPPLRSGSAAVAWWGGDGDGVWLYSEIDANRRLMGLRFWQLMVQGSGFGLIGWLSLRGSEVMFLRCLAESHLTGRFVNDISVVFGVFM